MGSCVPSKIPKNNTNAPIKQSVSYEKPVLSKPSKINGSFSIAKIDEKRRLQFQNAPLKNSDYLFNKFHHDNKPDELNLQWQLAQASYHDDTLKLQIISKLKVRLWVVVGGEETRAMTGLYMSIEKCSNMISMDLAAYLKEDEMLQSHEIKIGKWKSTQKLRVILESVSNPFQSFYLIYTFKYGNQPILKIERQELMWNSLAFQLQNIYNQQQSQVNNNALECVICNSEPSSCVIIPCKHMCIGRNCINSFKNLYKYCPLCKRGYTQIIVYRNVLI